MSDDPVVERPRRRPSFWAIGATLGMVAAGFRPRRFSAPAASAPGDAADGRPALGKEPDTPAEVSLVVWRRIFMRVYENLGDHHIFTLAAGITFYSLLALFPALAALVAIYGLFFDPHTITEHLDAISGFMPSGALDIAKDQLTRISSKGAQTLGLTFAAGFAVSLWSANAAMKSLFDALNVVYAEKEKRNFFRLNLQSLSFTLAGILFMVLAAGAVVVLPIALQAFGLANTPEPVLRFGRWPLLFVILMLALAVIYRFGPSRGAARWHWITWGSALASFLWLAASVLFSWYTSNFGNYNETYGSLGAVIGFMTWLWISSTAILIGAEVDAETERRAAEHAKV
jgi:membrane protein